MNYNTDNTKERIIKLIGIIVEYFIVFCSFFYIANIYFSNYMGNAMIICIIMASILTIVYGYILQLVSVMNYSIAERVYGISVGLILTTLLSHILFSLITNIDLVFNDVLIIFVVQYIILVPSVMIILVFERRFKKINEIILIGSNEEVEQIAKKMLASDKEKVNIIGIYCNLNSDLFSKIDQSNMVLVGNTVFSNIKKEIINYCLKKQKKVFVIPEIYDIAMNKSNIVQFDDMPLFSIDRLKLKNNQKRLKRFFDFVMSSVAIIIFSPILLIISIIIKLYDGGPIIYSQLRLTENGEEFQVHKFRSMVVNAEKITGAVLATEKDSRITPLGRILRSTRLDELPQFFNVFMGEMSLVGPRPERPIFTEQFEKEIPEFRQRLTVKAGITGLAQVLSNYTTKPEDKLIYDLQYIREYSFLLDLKIILQTIRIAFTKESSSGVKDDVSLEKEYSQLINDIM